MIRSLASLPIAETRRLRLAALSLADARELQKMTDDPAITAAIHFLPNPFTLEDAAALILGGKDGRNCFIGAWTREGGALIGVVGTHLDDNDEIEIGYWIKSSLQRMGFGTEAVKGVLALLRETFPQAQVFAECRIENIPSWRLLEKLGFCSSGEAGRRPGRQRLILK